MSIIATALRHLIAAGMSGDDLVRAVAEMEAEQAAARPVIEQAPSKGALRMRAYRERHSASRSVTCDARNVTSSQNVTAPAPSPLPLLSPQTPQITPTPLPHPEGIHAHEASPTGEPTAERQRQPKAPAAFPCPADVEPQHWLDLLANRKSKRLSNTPTAHKGILRDIAKFSDDEWPPGRIVQHAAERGWGAIFDPRQTNGNRNGQRTFHDRPAGAIESRRRARRDDGMDHGGRAPVG